MNILAVETTGASASVAVLNDEGEIFEESSDETLNHLQFLMPMIGKVLEKCKLQINDVTAIAASEGPGSFTGIRIGVSSARALAQVLEVPCISVPTLKTFLYNKTEEGLLYCPIFDARRSQVYGGAYCRDSGESIKEIVEGGAYTLEEFLAAIKAYLDTGNSLRKITFFGDGIKNYGDFIMEWYSKSLAADIKLEFAEEDIRYQKASSVVRLGASLLKEGRTCCYNDLKPNYMRKAEAERKLDAANAARLAAASDIISGVNSSSKER